jgi:hypothetical protein
MSVKSKSEKTNNALNELTDRSNDRQYFALTPHLVWALCEDPFEFTLWHTIRMITREGETCRLTTPDLAELCMMSVDKAHNCRKRLLDIGLLIGEIKKKDLHNPQPIWHLTIPDIWRPNLEWSQEHNTLEKKLQHKRLQRSKFKENRKKLRELKHLQDCQNESEPDTLQENEALLFSKSLTALQVVGQIRQAKMPASPFSPGEFGSLPDENGLRPDENGSLSHENSLIYKEPDQESELKPDKTTTTIQEPQCTQSFLGAGQARAPDQSTGGGGFSPSSEAMIVDQENTPPETALGHSLFSTQIKILAMRMLAAEIIDEIPTRWWGKEEFLAGLDSTQLYQLCAWLWIWRLVHKPPEHGGLLTAETLAQLDEQKTIDALYKAFWIGIVNVPAVIKTRLQEVEAPLDSYDQEQLNQHLRALCQTLAATHA